MPPKPLPPNELPAYHQAAKAVLANEFGIKIHRVSIKQDASGELGTRLATFQESCDVKYPFALRTIDSIEKYIATLLAGSAGRLIRVETNMGYKTRNSAQVRLQSKYAADVRNCNDRESDFAYCVALGWLSNVDSGDPIATIERLWLRANRLLRKDANRQRLDRVAERLKKTGEMCGREITSLLA